MSPQDVRMYSKLGSVSTFDDEVSVRVVEIGVEASLRGSHHELDVEVRMGREREREMRWQEWSLENRCQGS